MMLVACAITYHVCGWLNACVNHRPPAKVAVGTIWVVSAFKSFRKPPRQNQTYTTMAQSMHLTGRSNETIGGFVICMFVPHSYCNHEQT